MLAESATSPGDDCRTSARPRFTIGVAGTRRVGPAPAGDQARLPETGEEIALRHGCLDPRLAEDERLSRPQFTPALEAEREERAVGRNLRDVLLECAPAL